MQPIKLKNEKTLSRAWTPKGKVWFQKNDDTYSEQHQKMVDLHEHNKETIKELRKEVRKRKDDINWSHEKGKHYRKELEDD